MRYLLVFAVLIILAACNRSGKGAPAAPATSAARRNVVLLLSGTSASQWDSELLAGLGADLGVDPFARQAQQGALDVLGPYDVEIEDRPAKLSICLTGFEGLAGQQDQRDLAVDARAWIEKQKPDVLWLDGDRAQYFIGAELAGKVPIVFSGVASDRQYYYAEGATGVYERPALPALLELIWDKNPKAQRFALVSDAAPLSRGRVGKFNELLSVALSGKGKVVPTEPALNWAQLRARLQQAQKSADAVIVTGLGEEQGGEAFRPPCPPGLLKGITVPVVAVGSGDPVSCFPVTVRLRASSHARAALGMVAQVLGGAEPGGIPTVTPEDMQVTLNER